ncbi:protein WEAK CHLOROPLAST MOVEMENT UNDER BLUE LIGHT 1-like [Zingiber officinale]|uniref:protein WEAK CHLOROPLAST MOVEMENT UNDER BLUE LIGHT 1-like n=1 Tax=Zingiber officinale TaxID=94328 RepID=UPI001C4AA787|nr:protein WEAK CHLOROPLAST MOVEMENT UNDER BLUE LIGHT 1-like [Zingiber officinale]
MHLQAIIFNPNTQAVEGSDSSSNPHLHKRINVHEPESVVEPEEIPEHEYEKRTVEVSVEISIDSSSSTNSSNAEERSTMQPFELNLQKDFRQAKKNLLESTKSFKRGEVVDSNKGVIDTAVPFESVKEVVTKIGGILDWKAHKADTLKEFGSVKGRSFRHCRIPESGSVRNQNQVISELERIHIEISECKGQFEAAQEAKIQALRELEVTESIIEELQLKLEKAQKEESRAKQDSELTQLRVKEVEQGITSEASLVAKALLEVAKERHEAAVVELASVKEELEALRGEKPLLINERDVAMSKTQEVVSLAKEHRIGESLSRNEDYLRWEKELKMTEEEMHELDRQLALTKDLRHKLDTSTKLLQSLKDDLSKYMSEKLKQDSENNDKEKSDDETDKSAYQIQALDTTRKSLEEVRISMVRVKAKVDCLSVEAVSLKSALDAEKAAISTLKQKGGAALIVVSSLESDLDRTKQELEVVKIMERETKDKMMVLPMLLHQKTEEVDQAKAAALMARKQLRKAKEEAELAEASTTTTRSKLLVALKEKEAAQESENVALTAAKVLQESAQTAQIGGKDSLPQLILPPDEYLTLNKRVHEAEELAHDKLAAAVAQIDEAKISQNISIERLKEACRELEECKEAFKVANDKAKKGQEEKLAAEQELRKWRTELEQRRKANDAVKASVAPLRSPPTMQYDELKSMRIEENDDVVHAGPGEIETGVVIKKKKAFFPRLAHLLPKKSTQQVNSRGPFACLHAYYFEA